MERPGVANIHPELTEAELRISQRNYHFLLRIIQELIHNAQRHSSAWHIWVRIINQNNQLIIEVEDDGTPAGLHHSIEVLKGKRNSLRMRAISIGATLAYQQSPNGGLLVKINFPLGSGLI
jgi:signal transduction histidine kinase